MFHLVAAAKAEAAGLLQLLFPVCSVVALEFRFSVALP